MTNKSLKVVIKTFGCQMNVYDTQVASGILEHQGYEIVHELDHGAESKDQAGSSKAMPDVVIMNTCSVREHAEDRVFSRLGVLAKEKKTKPDIMVGLMGCMVEEHREKLFKRFPHLDFMVGTRNIKDLPGIIDQVREKRTQVARIKQDGISIEYTDQIKRTSPFQAWLPIMTGCNKVCTFCIVPTTRGAEVSMPAREVYREASRLVSEGVKWITLLGQNVNSYKGSTTTDYGPQTTVPSTVDRGPLTSSFPDLLESLCEIEGLERIAFTTSHPQDATEELYRVIARNPKISRRFHLPLQSGSDRILKRMKRLHTYAEYRKKIELMRELIPGVAITTDIITGFSGETPEDHKATAEALRELRFDSAYIFKYSLREKTPASKLPDDVSIEEKGKRHTELLDIQRVITQEKFDQHKGETLNVFIEAASPKDPAKLVGHSDTEKKVIFPGEAALAGQFRKIKIQDCRRETLVGTLVD